MICQRGEINIISDTCWRSGSRVRLSLLRVRIRLFHNCFESVSDQTQGEWETVCRLFIIHQHFYKIAVILELSSKNRTIFTMEEKLSDDINKLQEMFPRISERSIRFVFQKNRSDFDKTLDSLLDFPSEESNGSQPDNSGKVNSLGYRITEEIETFTIEDSGEEGNSSKINDNFTLNQTFDKLEFLSGIFPDVQKEYFKKHLDEINNDDAKFHIFLTDSLGDPNKLPRQTRLCSNKRDRDGNCDSNEVNEPSLTRSSKKPRTGKGKSVSKMSESGPGPAENVECSICQCPWQLSVTLDVCSACLVLLENFLIEPLQNK